MTEDMAENLTKITAKDSKEALFYPSVAILGVKANFINLKNALPLIENWVNQHKQHQITTPNPEQLVLAQKDKEFKEIINRSDLAIPDGAGVVWAAKLLYTSVGHRNFFTSELAPAERGTQTSTGHKNLMTAFRNNKLPSITRLTGTDLMVALCQLAAKKGWRVFLLGGKGGVAEKAAERLKHNLSSIHYPLSIIHYSGSSDIAHETPQEREEAVVQINNYKPHLLFVAYGAPYQEKWLSHNLPKLKVSVAMGVGGAFDYISGQISRAPQLMRRFGLEWLYRLFSEPWRWKRQLALVKFVSLVLKERSKLFL
jgi:N-acetylglucosaminyldiphosphoundecaprenol N-acetyl-beta-D-mannosaminyltransferase